MQVVQTGFSAALHREVVAGVRLGVVLRLGVVTAIALWVIQRIGLEAAWPYLAILLVLTISGIFQWRLAPNTDKRWRFAHAFFILLDMAAVTLALVIPPPGTPADWPAAMQLRLGNFDYFFIFVALTTLAYSPLLSIWTAIAAALTWSAGMLFILAQPGSFTITDFAAIRDLSIEDLITLLLNPNYVSGVIWFQEVLLVLILGVIMTATAFRTRKLAFREAKFAAERSNLSRYFSPNLVDELAGNQEDLTTVRSHEIAVLFADVVGFTKIAESQAPAEVIDLLRAIHSRLARVIFNHQGTLEKFMGDGLMATFGTPRPKADDAARALRAAFDLLTTMAEFNSERQAAGLSTIEIGIGLHVGPAVLGNIGDELMLEFTVVGDTVNVASRLEAATRELATPLVASETIIQRALEQAPELKPMLASMISVEPQQLHNRTAPVAVRVLRPAAAAVA